MGRVRSFDPVARGDAEVLILGSMPGEASLAAGRYYAHPRNQFWPIVGALLGVAPEADYERRLEALVEARIALWDVLHSCRRDGSLDSAIAADSEEANDFGTFFAHHPAIRRVVLNGAKADEAFRRRVRSRGVGAHLDCVRVPSTSPANASWSFERKLAVWRLAVLERPRPAQPRVTLR